MRKVALLIALAACSNDAAGTSEAKPTGDTPRKLAGVYPDKFQCESVATVDVLQGVLGGTVRKIDNPSSVPRGVAQPCNYEVETTPYPEVWTFDFDCRDGFKQRADALFKQYAEQSKDQVDMYNGLSDAGPKEGAAKRDAGARDKDAQPDAPQRAPELAQEVMVGMKGLDHHGQGLIFIDDDAPCYVRVTGPDSARRLELAKLLAKNLTFANAPMSPRAFK